MNDEPEIFEVLRKIRYDTTAIQAKITDALTMLANMNLPDTQTKNHICPKPHCRIGFHTAERLAEHMRNVHDPIPPLTAEEAQA